MWYVVRVRTQKEYEVEKSLIDLGIECWLPRMKSTQRVGKQRKLKMVERPYIPGFLFVDIPAATYRTVVEQRWVLPRMLPVIGLATSNPANTQKNITDLGSLGQFKAFRRKVERELEKATAIEEEANREYERTQSRQAYIAKLKQYKPGQAIEAVDGAFIGHLMKFVGLQVGVGGADVRIVGEYEFFGAPRRILLDPGDVREAQ